MVFNTKIVLPILIILIVGIIIAISTINTTDNYEIPNPLLTEIKRRFSIISPQYANIPLREGKKAFTEDKSVITLCLKDPYNGGKYYDINVLMYVACHELAHVVTKASGRRSHGSEFKANFSELLKDAASKGVYNPAVPIPTNYCGMDGHH